MIENYFPKGNADVILDTDAYNEVDDLVAISYLLRSSDKLNTVAIYAAPFLNGKVVSPKDGMEKSCLAIKDMLKMEKCVDIPVFYGSEDYLSSETEPRVSDAAQDLASRAMSYTSEDPLFVVSIGAITNIASALLINPEIKERIVVVWLAGQPLDYGHNEEFNLCQDIAAARIIFGSGVKLCSLPAGDVAEAFKFSRPELREWLVGNEICEYFVDITIKHMDRLNFSPYTSKVMWDVTAVAWLLNGKCEFMDAKMIPSPIPEYDRTWTVSDDRHLICQVKRINTNKLKRDMIGKLTRR